MNQQAALLQIDVVDSTRLTELLGDVAMAALWESHDRVSRDLLHIWRGRELERSDGFLLLFDTASDAANYAIEYHHAIDALNPPMKARAGLHVGTIAMRENRAADVRVGAKPQEAAGLAIPTAARVMSLAQGGQTLLTAAAKAAIEPTTHRLQCHGYWRLKGMEEPIELFEIGDADAPFTPPPDADKVYRVVRRDDLWLPLRQLRHSLLAERNPFIGREDPLHELARRIGAGARLVSVVGIGGAGKTRLVQRFGWMWLGDFEGGVWFCDLSQASDLDGVVGAVAHGLEVPLGNTDPVDQLGAALAGRGQCLVILDNFEQITRYAEHTVGQWLNRARNARFIVTTRTVLGIDGEEVLGLAPMNQSEGATLFLQRARAARGSFRLSADDRAPLETLIKLLDGLPLAIELAAARVRIMNVRTLLERMRERFDILASRDGRPTRQATLRAALDWSWDLLSATERTALAQLSVFEGGFGLHAAESLLDFSHFDNPPSPLDILQSLVEKSCVQQVADQRFALLGSVQVYAAEHLRTEDRFPASGPAARLAAQARHWRYFASLGETGAIREGWVELDNLVAACRHATDQQEPASAAAALAGAWAALKLCGPFRVAVTLAAAVRRMPGLMPADRALVELVAGSALRDIGAGAEARRCFDTGLAMARAASDRRREAGLLWALGAQQTAAGHPEEALPNLTAARAIARSLDDRLLECTVLNALGTLYRSLGQLEDERHYFEDALELARALGDRRRQGGLLGNLGGVYHGLGRLREAQHHYEQALSLAQETGDRRWEGDARCNLGLLFHDQGRLSDARLQLEAALASSRELGHLRLECTVSCNLGIVTEAEGKLDEALVHYERAMDLARELDDRRTEGQSCAYIGSLHARSGRFSEARDFLMIGEALLTEVSDRLSLAILLCSKAEAEYLAGRIDAARDALRAGEAIARDSNTGLGSPLGLSLARIRALLET